MTHVNGEDLLGSLSFRLGVVGMRITQMFGTRIEALGLTHKQVGVLAVVDTGQARSQREVADALGVAPSLVVTLVDRLVAMNALVRVQDTADRRVHTLELTDQGHQLLRRSVAIVNELDRDLRNSLSRQDAAAVHTALTHFMTKIQH
ncbi:DNA-binding MarR family transcriptional regulator [Nonomuraea thailandensis]|uniref:DNA-binding MarR family transcriptional regulator n=1 Tax=Nonomuraea thailandensis TaxID=1188745 RepID=A0A9X2GGB8_9ACTN|nr:MarR family winged helix-turn-helix transcriptional regulator [Nonomuraea thailandensis]MCP2353578.1 DNA-binding MarR family transcriptional regulator [Nonomuraea thailandensis]